jgi:hypothetical protein
MAKKDDRRHIMRVELTGPAKDNVAKLSGDHGMTQVAMMSRVVEWFAKQDELIQSAVLGRFPSEVRPDVVRLVLKRMAEN